MRLLFLVSIVTLAIGLQSAIAAPPPQLVAKHGVVATDQALASQAGVSVMKRGGNAVDAACAAAFALGIVNPAGSGIGGGGFMLIKHKGTANVIALDFREVAPAAATPNMFVNASKRSKIGGLAVGIPGEVMGCAAAVKRFGRLSLAQVLNPAIQLAQRGFRVGEHLARSIAAKAKKLRRNPQLKRVFFSRDGYPLKADQWMRRPKLARALRAIAKNGTGAFYKGWIAADIVASIRKSGGIITKRDLSTYRVHWRKPLTRAYHDHRLNLMPLPSSGGIVILQVLGMFSPHKLVKWGNNSSRYVHYLTEAFKHAFADRARYLGDSDYVDVPVARLISPENIRALRQRIDEKTHPWHDYGTRDIPRSPQPDSGTSHISVIDSDGNAVALTTSINGSFGSGVIGQRSGIIFNNTMDDFATQPGKPNAYGLRQGPANAIAPGKRPLSSMTPTIVTKGDKPIFVLGGSGGPTIITATTQVLLNLLLFQMNPSAAVANARIHHQWLPDVLWFEEWLRPDVLNDLKRRGHLTRLIRRPPHPFTAVQVAAVVAQGFSAASDPRKLGAPSGY